MSRPPSNVVDVNSPTANMYGCEPCSKCGSRYRCVFNDHPNLIQCKDCGYDELAQSVNGDEVEYGH